MKTNILEKILDACKKSLKTITEHTSENTNEELLPKLLPLIEMQSDVLITVVGIKHYFGAEPFVVGKQVHLIKEPGNKYDNKAISVFCENVGKCGYVANNPHTVKQGTVSAEQLAEGFEVGCRAKILYKDSDYVICSIEEIDFYRLLYRHALNFYRNNEFSLAIELLEAMSIKWKTPELISLINECRFKLNKI